MMKSEKLWIAVGFTVISIIWGSTWLAIKIGLDNVPPFFAVAIRFSLALLILSLIMLLRGEKLPLDRQAITLFFTLGLFSFGLPFAMVYWAEQYIPSSLASILFAVYPFVVAVASHFVLPDEPLTFYKTIGIILGFAGILVIFWENIHLGSTSTFGMTAILGSALCQGISLVMVKKIGKHVSPVALNVGGMLVGVVFLYSIALLFEDFSSIHFNTEGIGSIAYLGTLGTVVTFVVYYWLLKRVEAVYLSLVSFVTPVLALILGALLLHEALESQVFFGAGLVLIGILVANGRDVFAAVVRKASKPVSITTSEE